MTRWGALWAFLACAHAVSLGVHMYEPVWSRHGASALTGVVFAIAAARALERGRS